jgi:hypothetical protein
MMDKRNMVRLFSFAALAAGLLLPVRGYADTADPSAIHGANPATPSANLKSDGEIGAYTSTGTFRGKLPVGKIDPPAAFNLEDIQNFPEERLHPVLNNPVNFEEGRDFADLLNFQEEQMIHPWIPDFSQAPFLTMRGDVDSSAKEWTFSIIDQAAGAVWTQAGKGTPPADLVWNGEDKERGYVAVDTVYIPQISITNKEGYHRTYPGQPAQFSAIRYTAKGKNIVELSSKALFQERKTDLTKEGELLLQKVLDLIREEGKLPVGIHPYDTDADLARAREQVLAKYFQEKLFISASQIISSEVENPEKRGIAFAVILNDASGSNP